MTKCYDCLLRAGAQVLSGKVCSVQDFCLSASCFCNLFGLETESATEATNSRLVIFDKMFHKAHVA